MPGIRKAAVLMVVLGAKRASELIARCGISQGDIEKLAAEITRISDVDAGTRQAILDEFSHSLAAGPEVSGPRLAMALLAPLLGPDRAASVLSKTGAQGSRSAFSSLAGLSSKRLTELLTGEQPQMVAIALRYLPRVRAAEVLAELSQESRIEVVMRFVKSDDPLPEAVETLGRALWEKAGASGNLEEGPRTENAAGRARALVEMLNNADLAVEEAVLEGLVARDPELGEQVRESMFIFDDLPRLDPRALQLVLRSIEASDLTLALKGAPDEVKKAVSENLSENAAAALKEDLEAMGPVRRRDIYAAQQKVVTAVRTMAEEGHISIRATVQTDEFVA